MPKLIDKEDLPTTKYGRPPLPWLEWRQILEKARDGQVLELEPVIDIGLTATKSASAYNEKAKKFSLHIYNRQSRIFVERIDKAQETNDA